jgi:hypothetical protein
LISQGQQHAILGGRRLQLEVEGAAEALAQRHAPGAVDSAAERGVDDELHAARLVEEALGHHHGVAGHRAQHLLPQPQVAQQRIHRGRRHPQLLGQEGGGVLVIQQLLAQPAHLQ